LRESLKVKLKEQRKLPSKVQVNNALKGSIAEFMSCFILIGFDLDGTPIAMTIYNNKMEKAALDNVFIQKFGEYMGSTYRHD
jgi:hypothetical protein